MRVWRRMAGVLFFLWTGAGAMGAEIETLIMPGEVIEGHAKYESACTKCHEPFSKTNQDTLCLDCHKDVARDVEAKAGYHGRLEGSRACKACHTDHKGRGADIVGLDSVTFDHHLTDFVLEGAHVRVKCAACHKSGEKYRKAPVTCVACHREGDPHKGRLGDKCERCHGVETWRKARAFDHGKTDYPLDGKHVDVACKDCHANERYKGVAKTCNACHALDDVHATRYGEKCQSCHSTAEWKRIRFVHDRDTRYRLAGAHGTVRCDACHREPLYKSKTPTACYDCHANDDEHKERYGRKCDACHDPRKWSEIGFDHDTKTDFALRGKHKKAACGACHRGIVKDEKLGTKCDACHRADDVHQGGQGRDCARCHNENTWRDKVRFDHDLVRFPLIGLHVIAPCESCHVSTAYKDTARACDACHARDDVHRRKLGPDCQRCHNPNSWRLWQFDHSRTDYKLDGKHVNLDCISCHRTPVSGRIRLSHTCGGCHREDDPHNGGFGAQCERCHNTESFDRITLSR